MADLSHLPAKSAEQSVRCHYMTLEALEHPEELKAPPGVIEAIELYEAAAIHYAKAASYTIPVSRVSSTSAGLAASLR